MSRDVEKNPEAVFEICDPGQFPTSSRIRWIPDSMGRVSEMVQMPVRVVGTKTSKAVEEAIVVSILS